MEQGPDASKQTAEQAYLDEIARRDKKFGIIEYDTEDTLPRMYVGRGSGKVGLMTLIGQSEDGKVGKVIEFSTRSVKYIPLQETMARQDELRDRHEREQMHVTEQLGVVAVEQSAETPVARQEQEDRYDYLRTALPPVTRPESTSNYDVLLYGSDREVEEDHVANQLTPEQEQQKRYYDRHVTEENKAASLEALARSTRIDPELARILQGAGLDAISAASVDAIRENPEVRYEVAKYLVQKLDMMVNRAPRDFGWRIEKNSPNNLKADPQTGQRMRSRLYAVSMAMKMIDGEFSFRDADDSFARDEQGRVAMAQHRDAAQTLLYGI